jgi:hypothetical protein
MWGSKRNYLPISGKEDNHLRETLRLMYALFTCRRGLEVVKVCRAETWTNRIYLDTV